MEMTPEEMRRLGYRVIDELIDRWTHLRDEAAWRGGTRHELEPILGGRAPETPGDPDQVLDLALNTILPRAGRIDHPRFFAFIPSSPTWPGLLGDVLASGFNVFQGTWLESAGPSQVELVVLDWFREWLGFPETGGGVLTSGGSAANLGALVAAREAAGNPAGAVVYVSDQGHSSLERAALIAGIPGERVRKIATDCFFRMDLDALASAIAEDGNAGLTPLCICANAGATSTGAIDELDGIADIAERENVWFHVDGAYGGFSVLVPEERENFRGMERADSVTLDPHKWLFQSYETGCLMVRDTGPLESAFRILPDYLQDTDLGREQVNFADRGVQLSRSFRALKIWMSIQTLGLGAFRDTIRQGITFAKRAESYIQNSTHLEMLGPSSLGIVCFRYQPSGPPLRAEALEELNQAIQHDVVSRGISMMSSTRLRGTFSLRLCIMNYRSTWADVRETLEALEEAGGRLSGSGSSA